MAHSEHELTSGFREIALFLAVVLTVVGVGGFVVTHFDSFAGNQHEKFIWFQVNPFQNLVHLALGIVGLVAGRSRQGLLTFGTVAALVCGAWSVYGVLAAGSSWDAFALNEAANGFHIGVTTLSTMVAFGAASAKVDSARVGGQQDREPMEVSHGR